MKATGSDRFINIRNAVGTVETVPATWDTDSTVIKRFDPELQAIVDTCKHTPRKTNPSMPAARPARDGTPKA